MSCDRAVLSPRKLGNEVFLNVNATSKRPCSHTAAKGVWMLTGAKRFPSVKTPTVTLVGGMRFLLRHSEIVSADDNASRVTVPLDVCSVISAIAGPPNRK